MCNQKTLFAALRRSSSFSPVKAWQTKSWGRSSNLLRGERTHTGCARSASTSSGVPWRQAKWSAVLRPICASNWYILFFFFVGFDIIFGLPQILFYFVQ
jgi:hypothetical protein